MSNELKTSADFKDDILREQFRLVIKQLPTMQAVSFVVALILAYSVRNVVPHSNILIWLMTILAVVICRAVLYVRFRRVREEPFAGHYWQRIYLILALVSGIFWGLSAFIIYPVGNPALISLFVLVIASLASATTVSHSPLRFGPMLWGGPALLPYALRSAMKGEEFGYLMSILILLYLYTVLRYSFDWNDTITDAISLRFENLQLLERVSNAGEILEKTVEERTIQLKNANETLKKEIRERIALEDALRESEARYRAIFENTGAATVIVDEDTTISLANAEFVNLTGYEREEIEGKKSWTEFVLKDELEWMMRQHESRRIDEDVAQRSYEFHLVDRESNIKNIYLTVDMIPATSKSVASLLNITERKQAENEVRESRRRLLQIIEFLPEAILVIDKDGKILAWNRAMEALTGVKAEGMIGKGNNEYSIPFYGDRRPTLIDLALHPHTVMREPYTTIRRRGDATWSQAFTPPLLPGNLHLSATASVLLDSKGEAIAAIECIRDNTEQIRLEQRLSRAEKMEALGTLAGGVAHDLNNVLGVLVGYSELLLERISKTDPLYTHVFHILQSSLRGAAIIQDLLTLARRGVAVAEVVNLNHVVSDYFGSPEFENLKVYHPNVIFSTHLEQQLLNIKGSPIHLTKTVMNLVANAAESIQGSGTVIATTENRYLDKPLQSYDDMSEGDYVVLSVSDNGRGINPADLGKIFEPFYTKKVMGRSGTGLGLAVVWGTVKDHGGYIDVRSKEGEGSTLTVYLPVTREEMTREHVNISPEQYMGAGASVLVVDDVEGQRELAVSMLTRLGYKADAVSCGEDAVEYIKASEIDLAVLDMIMEPGIDGCETFRRMLEVNPKQKAIIVSGFSETERVKEALRLGAGAYVKKPYVLEDLGSAVKGELERTKPGCF